MSRNPWAMVIYRWHHLLGEKMRIGQTERTAPPPLRELLEGDHPSFVANLVEVALFQVAPEHKELFPPSKGEVAIATGRVACRKQSAVRVTVAPTAQIPCQVTADRIVLDGPGWQYLAFDLDEVSDAKRTKLRDHLVVVEDEGTRFEVVLGGGSRADRVVERIERCRRGADDGDGR